MTLKPLEIEYVEIAGVNTPVRPEVAYRGENLIDTQLYTQDNGFVVLDSPEINVIATFLKPEIPNPEWIKQQAKKLKVRKEIVENTYAKFRDDVLNKYIVRSGEILVWPPYSVITDNPELNKNGKKPVLLRGYEILEKGKGHYMIKDGKVIEVNLPTKDGKFLKNLAQLLNARDDTYVEPGDNPHSYEQSLDWDFRLHMPLHLTFRFTGFSWFKLGSLLGSEAPVDSKNILKRKVSYLREIVADIPTMSVSKIPKYVRNLDEELKKLENSQFEYNIYL